MVDDKSYLTDEEFRALMNLMMVDDGRSVTRDDEGILQGLLRHEAYVRGYSNWIDAWARRWESKC